MQISMQLGYSGGFEASVAEVVALEKEGLDTVWVAEAYGFDGVSLMGYLAARTERVRIASGILPIYTRTPTLLAMTAAGVDAGVLRAYEIANPREMSVDGIARYWRKGQDSYALVSTDGTLGNADPLEFQTGQTRHRLGISVTYSTLQKYREGAANFPVELWVVYQGSLAGGGAQTPSSELASLSLLFPVSLF